MFDDADQVRLPGHKEFGIRSLRETRRGGLEDAARRRSSRDHDSILDHGQKSDHVVRGVYVHRRPVLSHDHAVTVQEDQRERHDQAAHLSRLRGVFRYSGKPHVRDRVLHALRLRFNLRQHHDGCVRFDGDLYHARLRTDQDTNVEAEEPEGG